MVWKKVYCDCAVDDCCKENQTYIEKKNIKQGMRNRHTEKTISKTRKINNNKLIIITKTQKTIAKTRILITETQKTIDKKRIIITRI